MDPHTIFPLFRMINQSGNELTDAHIPAALCNHENRSLDEHVQVKLKELSVMQCEIDENIDRVRMLEEHEKIIVDELATIQVDYVNN
jgi:hypothetical protein